MSRTLSKFCLAFDEATAAVQFSEAIKRPRKNAGHGWPKDKKAQLLIFLPEKLENFRSTELYNSPLEESTIPTLF